MIEKRLDSLLGAPCTTNSLPEYKMLQIAVSSVIMAQDEDPVSTLFAL